MTMSPNLQFIFTPNRFKSAITFSSEIFMKHDFISSDFVTSSLSAHRERGDNLPLKAHSDAVDIHINNITTASFLMLYSIFT